MTAETSGPVRKSLDANGLQFAWDATSINLAATCLRKYQLRFIEGWQAEDKSIHLRFGAHYATALEHFYKLRATGASTEEALRAVVREALINTWKHDRTPEGKPIPNTGHAEPFSDPRAPGKTRPNLIRTIIDYIDTFANETDSLMKTHRFPDGAPAVEVSFSLNITDDIVLCGHLDRIVNYGGHLYVMDQKTTGRSLTPFYFSLFNLNDQMSLYAYAGKAILSSPVRGVIIDAACVQVRSSTFARGFTVRTEAQLNEWMRAAMHVIGIARAATASNHFPQNTTACGYYNGCEYRSVCALSPEIRENFLKSNFIKEEKWDPLKRR